MLFLGAGASYPFGISQLQGFTATLNDILSELGYENLQDHIYQILLEANQGSTFFVDENEIDMEVILSILELMVHPFQAALQGGGPRIIYLNQLVRDAYNGNVPNEQELDQIKRRVEEVILTSCMNCDFNRAIEFYEHLFRSESQMSLDYVNATGIQGGTPLFRHAATTNYDLILEHYDKDYDIRFNRDRTTPSKHFLRRGFTTGNYQWNEPYLDLPSIDLPRNQNSLIYLKLHGSIDWWFRNSDGRIVPRECNHSLMGEVYDRRLMVYPAYDKRTTRDPFAALHTTFQTMLSINDVYIVVGYSFRDFSINEAFRNALETNESRMIIVNPNRNRIINKIQDFPDHKIDIIEIPFGDESLLDTLNTVLRRPPQGRG